MTNINTKWYSSSIEIIKRNHTKVYVYCHLVSKEKNYKSFWFLIIIIDEMTKFLPLFMKPVSFVCFWHHPVSLTRHPLTLNSLFDQRISHLAVTSFPPLRHIYNCTDFSFCWFIVFTLCNSSQTCSVKQYLSFKLLA